jgi:hypothetical protein
MKSHFPSKKMGKFQFPFYPFKTLTEGFRKGENEDKND